jgi:hypothetical protein
LLSSFWSIAGLLCNRNRDPLGLDALRRRVPQWPAGGDGKREAVASTKEDGRGGVRAQRPDSRSDGAGVRGGARLGRPARECSARRRRNGEVSRGQKRVRSGVEWLGTARTSRRASVLSGIWRQEDTVLLSQREKREKLYTNDEWAPQEFPFSDLTNMDSGFWPRKNI